MTYVDKLEVVPYVEEGKCCGAQTWDGHKVKEFDTDGKDFVCDVACRA